MTTTMTEAHAAILAASGRTASGEMRSTGRIRVTGKSARPKPGTVRAVGDTRVLILESDPLEYFDQDSIDEGINAAGISAPPGGSAPGYYTTCLYVPVEPTAEESAADAAQRAVDDDHREIKALLDAAKAATGVRTITDRPHDRATITETGVLNPYGRIMLTDSGAWYTNCANNDVPRLYKLLDDELAARAERVAAGGTRTIGRLEVVVKEPVSGH